MNMKMIRTLLKGLQILLNRVLTFKIIVIVFFSQLFLFENTYVDFMRYGISESSSLTYFFIYQLSDRFIIILGSGLAMLVIFHKLFLAMENDYFKMRIGNERRVNLILGLAIIVCALIFISIQIGICVFIGIIGGIPIFLEELNVVLIVKLCLNLILYYITLGNFSWMLYKTTRNSKVANLVVVAILIMNLAISGSTNFLDTIIGRFSWIGNIMVMETEKYSTNLMYWGAWISICVCIVNIRGFYNEKKFLKRVGIGLKRYVVFGVSTISIFFVYGLVSKRNLFVDNESVETILRDSFIGYKEVGIYLFLYLFYQLPIWIGAYTYLTRHFTIYGIQYLIRIGSIGRCLKKVLLKCVGLIVSYYIIGVIILIVINQPVYITEQNLYGTWLIVSNLVLQTILIVSISFMLWMVDESGHDLSVICVWIAHLILVMIGATSDIFGKWCPLTQGIYYINRNHALFSQVYQCGWIVLILSITIMYLKCYQNEVVTRKKSRF